MPDVNRRVQAIIDSFVAQLAQVAREEATRVVMGGLAAPGRGTRSPSSTSRGTKRSAEDLARLEQQLLTFAAKHPGLRIEQINEQLGTSTKDLALPIRKLVANKKLKTVGQRRSTKYFVSGSGGGTAKNGATPRARVAKGRRRTKK